MVTSFRSSSKHRERNLAYQSHGSTFVPTFYLTHCVVLGIASLYFGIGALGKFYAVGH